MDSLWILLVDHDEDLPVIANVMDSGILSFKACKHHVAMTEATCQHKPVNFARETARLRNDVASNHLRLNCTSREASRKCKWKCSALVLVMEFV
jgi:hypothetical protein